MYTLDKIKQYTIQGLVLSVTALLLYLTILIPLEVRVLEECLETGYSDAVVEYDLSSHCIKEK